MDKIAWQIVRKAAPVLFGAVGAVVAMVYPIGHNAFCTGIVGGAL